LGGAKAIHLGQLWACTGMRLPPLHVGQEGDGCPLKLNGSTQSGGLVRNIESTPGMTLISVVCPSANRSSSLSERSINVSKIRQDNRINKIVFDPAHIYIGTVILSNIFFRGSPTSS
jgi:hypothetical protein